MTTPEPDQAVRVLGDFSLLRKLGHGAWGEEWLAHQVSKDRHAFVTLLPDFCASLNESGQRFAQAVKIHADLVHPNLVQIYGQGVEDGTPYLIQEYVGDETLDARMIYRNVWLPYAEIVRLITEVASALHYLHERGFVHREICPHSIRIGANGHVKVSLCLETFFAAPIIIKSIPYLSPEEARNALPDPDGRSDLYSLGVLLYEVLTGQLPYSDYDPAMYLEVTSQPPPPPAAHRANIPPFLSEIALKLLKPEPNERGSAADLLSALQA